MGELRESSLLFSLQLLEDIEKQRLDQERAAEAQRRETERAEQLDRERRAREDARRQKEYAERRQAELERERHEEQTRLEAMQRALLESARLEVEARARAQEDAAQRQHAQRLAEIRGHAGARRLRALFTASLVAFVAAAVSACVLAWQLDEARRLSRQYEQLRVMEREGRTVATRLLEQARDRIEALSRDVEDLRRQHEEADTSREATPRPRPPRAEPRPRTPPGTRPAPAIRCGADGDPLDGCLPG